MKTRIIYQNGTYYLQKEHKYSLLDYILFLLFLLRNRRFYWECIYKSKDLASVEDYQKRYHIDYQTNLELKKRFKPIYKES